MTLFVSTQPIGPLFVISYFIIFTVESIIIRNTTKQINVLYHLWRIGDQNNCCLGTSKSAFRIVHLQGQLDASSFSFLFTHNYIIYIHVSHTVA